MIGIHIWLLLGFSLLINGVMFLVAYLRQTDKLTDISYALSFVALMVAGLLFGGASTTRLLLASMIAVWAGRLGGYLLARIRRIGRDKRFDEMRHRFWKFGQFWLLQGASVWVISLAALLVLTGKDELFYPGSLVGVAVWAVGLIIEAFADQQKFAFISDPANKGTWIDSGVWRYSRHPNYFGEIMVWLGVFLVAVPSLSGAATWIAAVSPLYIAALLLFVSGIPPLEKSADKRWGDDPAYQAYKARTSILIPLPPKK